MSSDEEESFLFEEDEESVLAVGVIGSVATNSGYVAVTVEKPGGGFEDMIDPSISGSSSESAPEVEEAQESEEQDSPLVRRESSKLDRSSEDTPESPMTPYESGSDQIPFEELLKSPMSTNSPKPEIRSLRSRSSRSKAGKRKKRRKRKERPTHDELNSGLPVLNRDTENKLTYDIEYLLEAQKLVHAKHRFVAKSQTPVPEHATEPFDHDYIRQNIEIALPKPTFHTQSVSVDRILPKVEEKKQKQSVDFVGRLYKYKEKVEEKLKLTKEQLMQVEKDVCTFVPSITKSAMSSRERRHPEDLYYAGMSKAQEAKQKMSIIRQELRAAPGPFRPSLNQNSLKMLSRLGRDSTPVYKKLYSAHKEAITQKIKTTLPRSKSIDGSELTFKPTINKRSEAMNRNKQINEMLYDDAKRRAQKPVPKLEPFQQKLISRNSEKVLREKFESDFRRAWGGEGNGSVERIEKCLGAMHFGSVTELEKPAKLIWEALQGDSRDGVKSPHLLTFLKAIMRFTPSSKLATDQTEHRFGHFSGDTFVFTSKDLHRVHSAFQSLYEARLAVVNKSNVHPQYRSVEQLSFKPDITLTSQTPRASRRQSLMSQSGSVENRLLAETQKKLEKMEKVKEALHREQMSQCTFAPDLHKSKHHRDRSFSELCSKPPSHSNRNLALYRLADAARARREEKAELLREKERNMHGVECPFSPSVDLTEAKYKEETELKAEGYDETIGRMRKAREEKQRLKAVMQRGEPSDYFAGADFHYGIERTFKGAVRRSGNEPIVILPQKVVYPKQRKTSQPAPRPVKESTQPSQSLQWTPEEMMKKLQAIPQNEIMTVSVNVKPGQAEDLTLYEGDDLTSVVSSFAQKHGLAQEDMFKLRSLISAQLLAKDY